MPVKTTLSYINIIRVIKQPHNTTAQKAKAVIITTRYVKTKRQKKNWCAWVNLGIELFFSIEKSVEKKKTCN